MIVIPQKLSWFRVIIRFRESALIAIWKRVLFATLVASLVTWLHLQLGWFQLSLTPLPFTFVGLALSIFLGFRNSTSYDRFWEGRKLWGSLVNTSRNLGRRVQIYITPNHPEDSDAVQELQHQLVYYLIAYVHAFRCHLRGDTWETLRPLITPSDFVRLQSEKNPPMFLAFRLSEMVQKAHSKGWLNTFHLPLLEDLIAELLNIQGGCERIKSTPIPFAYTVLLHRLVVIYTTAMPFGIIDAVSLYTPFVVFIVAYAFLGLDAIGDSIENPFDMEVHDLPLSAMSRMIEVNLRQQLGEKDLPPLAQPDENWVLL